MNKITLDTFIQKYNLGGNVNSVKWESDGSTLSTRFISPDKSLLGQLTVMMKHQLLFTLVIQLFRLIMYCLLLVLYLMYLN